MMARLKWYLDPPYPHHQQKKSCQSWIPSETVDYICTVNDTWMIQLSGEDPISEMQQLEIFLHQGD